MAKFQVDKRASREYQRAIGSISVGIGSIVKRNTKADGSVNTGALSSDLRRYSNTLDGWAKRIIDKMIAAALSKSAESFKASGVIIKKGIAANLKIPFVAKVIKEKRKQSLALIKSIPTQAAERAKGYAEKAVSQGLRASYVAEQIAKTEQVTKSRAGVIARTEIAKTQSAIVEAQALNVGATHYIWRTAQDGAVRDSHREMEGKKIPFNKAPTLSDGTTTHAGEIYECRCYKEPIFD